MNITLDYLYIFACLSGYIVRWIQVSKPFTFWLMVIALIIAAVWWLTGDGGDDFTLDFNQQEPQQQTSAASEACTKENPYGYDANGVMNICVFK